MNNVNDKWENGDPYEFFMGRWSKLMAPVFLSWLTPPANSIFLEIGCGTGALSEAIFENSDPKSLTSIEPSEGFLMKAKQRLEGKGNFKIGIASSLPEEDNTAEVIVSGLALNFFNDVKEALSEMKRVSKPGGLISAYVWDYSGKMEMLRYFWDAAILIDPKAKALDEGNRFPICNHGRLKFAFEEAGLSQVETTNLDITTHFRDFNDYWEPFLGEQGPAPGYYASLPVHLKEKLKNQIRNSLPMETDGSVKLLGRAIGIKATA